MAKRIEDINFATDEPLTYLNEPAKFFENMTREQAADILEKQVQRYHKGGEFSPRPHLGRALEIALEALRQN